jgi:hypothetical protein
MDKRTVDRIAKIGAVILIAVLVLSSLLVAFGL